MNGDWTGDCDSNEMPKAYTKHYVFVFSLRTEKITSRQLMFAYDKFVLNFISPD